MDYHSYRNGMRQSDINKVQSPFTRWYGGSYLLLSGGLREVLKVLNEKEGSMELQDGRGKAQFIQRLLYYSYLCRQKSTLRRKALHKQKRSFRVYKKP